jgi:two-component system cell cycle response regulator
MDIQLPGLDGLSATRMIKSDEKLKHIPVVALTSYAMQGDDQKAQAAGCDGYVTKPIDTRTFNKIVESYFKVVPHDNEVPAQSIRSRPLILIVDDEPKNIKLLRAKLSKTPYQIEQAINGLEAIKKAQTLLPDLILLDVMMPEIDGYEVARRLKTDPKLNITPIIMVTSLDSADAKVKGMKAGAEEFMTKPIHTEKLMARIDSMIQFRS